MNKLTILEQVFVPLELLERVDEKGNRLGSGLSLKRIGIRARAEVESAKDPKIVAAGYYSMLGGIATSVSRLPDFNAVLVGRPVSFEKLPVDFKSRFASSHKRESNYWPVTFYQINEEQAQAYKLRRDIASRD